MFILCGGFNFRAVELEEGAANDKRNAFFAVDERVVSCDAECLRRG